MKNIVYIRQYSNTYVDIATRSNDILRAIKRRFTFDINPYKTKNKLTRLCIMKRDKYLYRGLLDDLIMFLEETSIPYEIDPELQIKNSFSVEKMKSAIDRLKLNMVPTQYQTNAVRECLRNKRQIVLSPTSSGKSLMIYSMAMLHLMSQKEKKKILLVVPSIGLTYQMFSDFVNWCHRCHPY